jgi:hypothetical protein
VTGENPAHRAPAVWLGDAVRAAAQLHADPAVTRQVMALLGLAVPVRETPRGPADDGTVEAVGIPVMPSRATLPTVPTVRQVALGSPPPESEAEVTPLVEHSGPDPARTTDPPRSLPAIKDLLPPPPTPVSGWEPLLPPAQQRTILSALCRSPAPTGDLDVEELVDRIARREPLRTLPLATVLTTRRGVQVLVDFGDGMRPFVRDQEDLVLALLRIAGPDGFEVLRFSGTPLDEPGAGTGPIWTWRPYRRPLAAQPVVVLSDLGAGIEPARRRAVQRRWTTFAAALRAAGNQVVALAPVPADRWPAELRAAMPILTWDRTIRVADAVLAVGRQLNRMRSRS